jgi:hypothetical protein
MPSPFLVTTQARLLCLQRLRRRLHLQRFFDSAQRNTERLSHLRVARQQAP